MCASGTATLDVDSKASNISWELSPSYLFSGSTSGTGKTAAISAASNRSGQGKITYSFDMPDGENFSIEKTFCIGKPQLSVIHMDFTNGVGDNGYFCTTHSDNEFDLSYYNNYACCDNYEVKLTYLDGTVVDQFYTSSTGDLDYSNLNEGYYLFYARGHNDCGWGAWCETEIEYADCSQMMLMVFPNPTSGETTLSIVSGTADQELKLATSIDVFDETAEWDLEVYNNVQSLKHKKTKIKGTNNTKINTQSWKEGVYTVRVKYKGEVITGKLVVKK